MSTVNGISAKGASRRRFLNNTSVLGAASLLGLSPEALAEAPPEVTKIRLVKVPAICLALLRTHVRRVALGMKQAHPVHIGVLGPNAVVF